MGVDGRNKKRESLLARSCTTHAHHAVTTAVQMRFSSETLDTTVFAISKTLDTTVACLRLPKLCWIKNIHKYIETDKRHNKLKADQIQNKLG